ncbi:aminotransferase class I/II-fold pyridoxal phosphate-dependent enzyme, partial [bacterium]|nr:aminotransferase class I/II-fold pyridoxal phosphate-dependent enzyme [bacterium]
FFVYAFAAQRHGVEAISYSRTNNYHLPAINELAWQNNIPLTFIANPNNPTGTLSPREQVIEYIQHAPGIIVVDECYYEFSGETVVDLIHGYKNLIVFRSLSKSFGLAGLRLGYLAAHESLADRLARSALTFSVNALAQAAGTAALDELDIHRQRIQTLIQDRDTLQKELEALGLAVLPSATNFLLTLWPTPIENPAAKLAGQGILVSDQTKNMQTDRPALRIALGTNEENARLVGCIRGIMKNAGVEG